MNPDTDFSNCFGSVLFCLEERNGNFDLNQPEDYNSGDNLSESSEGYSLKATILNTPK